MRKRIIGGAFIAAAMALALQLPQANIEKLKEVDGIPTRHVPVTLVETVDGDTIKGEKKVGSCGFLM
jgi:hypothetical protein